jgi:hypothetical protein
MADSFVIFKKIPKVNCYPMGENSPNLVTLPEADIQPRKSCNKNFENKI